MPQVEQTHKKMTYWIFNIREQVESSWLTTVFLFFSHSKGAFILEDKQRLFNPY